MPSNNVKLLKAKIFGFIFYFTFSVIEINNNKVQLNSIYISNSNYKIK